MNTTAMRLRGGDVIELEIDGDIFSALVLLANSETVIFDLCDGTMPCVALASNATRSCHGCPSDRTAATVGVISSTSCATIRPSRTFGTST